MSFQVHSKAALIITSFSFGSLLLPPSLQAHKPSIRPYKKESLNELSSIDTKNKAESANRDKSRNIENNSAESKNIDWHGKETTIIGKAERCAALLAVFGKKLFLQFNDDHFVKEKLQDRQAASN